MSYDDRKNYRHSTIIDRMDEDFQYSNDPNVLLWIIGLIFLVAAIVLIIAAY